MLLLVQLSASNPERQLSRTLYDMLDVSPEEQDPKVIEEAALRCSSCVRTYQLTCESECTVRLNEIAQALITLLDPVRRREYDLSLGRFPSTAATECQCVSSTGGDKPRVLLIGDEETCDVKLVYRKCVF
jgi:hypothetical protein